MRKRYKAISLIMFSTLLTATAQTLFKFASSNISLALALFTNIPLILGFAFYGLGALLMILALKYGNLSLVYPFFSLSYIWVTASSMYFFNEIIPPMKIMGVIIIVIGVSLLGVKPE
ncbi:EamA/RhaT family transporter [Candidatus Woesearchaeota archaeon]|nr:EamA/RhaT family transporter [Candidatus Woesearchaeota archaeon]